MWYLAIGLQPTTQITCDIHNKVTKDNAIIMVGMDTNHQKHPRNITIVIGYAIYIIIQIYKQPLDHKITKLQKIISSSMVKEREEIVPATNAIGNVTWTIMMTWKIITVPIIIMLLKNTGFITVKKKVEIVLAENVKI